MFDVAVGARAISHMGHIKMMAAVQPFISGAISKTVNMPGRDGRGHRGRLLQAWRWAEGAAIYRDGSKTAQALRTDAQEEAGEVRAAEHPIPRRTSSTRSPTRWPRSARGQRLRRERESLTHKFSVAGHGAGISSPAAATRTDGGEIFLTDIGKDGSTLRGMMNAFATAISIGLQYGVPLKTFVKKFSDTGAFTPRA